MVGILRVASILYVGLDPGNLTSPRGKCESAMSLWMPREVITQYVYCGYNNCSRSVFVNKKHVANRRLSEDPSEPSSRQTRRQQVGHKKHYVIV